MALNSIENTDEMTPRICRTIPEAMVGGDESICSWMCLRRDFHIIWAEISCTKTHIWIWVCSIYCGTRRTTNCKLEKHKMILFSNAFRWASTSAVQLILQNGMETLAFIHKLFADTPLRDDRVQWEIRSTVSKPILGYKHMEPAWHRCWTYASTASMRKERRRWYNPFKTYHIKRDMTLTYHMGKPFVRSTENGKCQHFITIDSSIMHNAAMHAHMAKGMMVQTSMPWKILNMGPEHTTFYSMIYKGWKNRTSNPLHGGTLATSLKRARAD